MIIKMKMMMIMMITTTTAAATTTGKFPLSVAEAYVVVCVKPSSTANRSS